MKAGVRVYLTETGWGQGLLPRGTVASKAWGPDVLRGGQASVEPQGEVRWGHPWEG